MKAKLCFWFVPLLCLLAAAAGCRQKPVAPPERWAAETRASSGGIEAVLRLSATRLTPGARLDLALELQIPQGTRIEQPSFSMPDFEQLDLLEMPVSLRDNGEQLRRFRWKLQAGPVSKLDGQKLKVEYSAAGASHALELSLPALEVVSAFAPGKPGKELPPLEEHNAL